CLHAAAGPDFSEPGCQLFAGKSPGCALSRYHTRWRSRLDVGMARLGCDLGWRRAAAERSTHEQRVPHPSNGGCRHVSSALKFPRNAVLLVFTTALAACGRSDPPGTAAHASIQPGIYRLVLRLPGGDLPLGLDLAHEQSGWVGYFINGPERLKLNEVAVEGAHLESRMPGYEKRVTADANGDELQGEVVLSKPDGKDQHLPLLAQYQQTYRFFPTSSAAGMDVSGRWSVTFSADDGTEEHAVGEFSQS